MISVLRGVPWAFAKRSGHLVLALVQGRTDDVRRRLVVVDLQDVFAQVGLDHLEPAASIARSSSDSSLTIDFDLMILATRVGARCRARGD